ncbi:fibronectin type III domain-containing protein [Flavobacterium aquidurense]|uniref:Fn3 domain containing protein n=1 Tax=Flavobacterium aquidurense TaxID=362413 RepID=A0A0Q0RS65_9FLAO|nr:fibronectin type III domain-containing protein [Flavobacterium aquidurense]KQB39451.1 Fn3 domain containing protein [Flavobacterium aquidurense]
MKQVNFSHSGGFPLEQETLERLQTAYRSELFEALKSHLSIDTGYNYIVAPATNAAKGWAIIQQDENNLKDSGRALPQTEGILYPIAKGSDTGYLKTTRTGTNLVYGTGVSQTAYFDYEAEYITETEYGNGISQNSDELRIEYYDLANFKIVKDIQSIQADIDTINQTYLPLDGSKAMKGDLDLDIYQLSKLDIRESSAANVRVADFRMGSASRRGLKNPGNPLGRALVDSSDAAVTNLHLNYESDWDNTYVGGKVHFNNLNTSTENFNDSESSDKSLLLMDDYNQVVKSNNLLNSLLGRISELEKKPATAVPIGMIAIWGKPAPFPDGWEEYVPLRGKMPVGLFNPTIQERSDLLDGDGGNGLTYNRDSNGNAIFPFETIADTGGRIGKKLTINEIPPHTHTETRLKDNATSNIIHYESVGDDRHAGYETVNSGSAGGGLPFSIINPYRVVYFIEYTGGLSDKTKPTNLIVTNIDFTSLRLTWTAPIDSTGLSNYVLYKNGSEFVTLGNTVTSHPVSGLTKGTYYTFSVVAKNTAGTLSAASTANATTKDVDPTMPTNLHGESQGENSIYISWGAPATPGVLNYEIYRRQTGTTSALHKTVLGNITSYVDSGSYSTTYIYKVRAIYSSGTGAFTESEVEVTTDPIDIQCFDVESLVTMASGQSKKLKNIVIGDKLQGFSFPNEIDESDGDYMIWNGKLNEAAKAEVTVVNKITSIQPSYYEIKTADTTLKVTGQHPLLVSEDGENVKWVCVKNVLPYMLLIDKNGKTKTIESIVFVEEPLEVALLDVETVDNYVISGIVAHNNKPLDPHDPQP